MQLVKRDLIRDRYVCTTWFEPMTFRLEIPHRLSRLAILRATLVWTSSRDNRLITCEMTRVTQITSDAVGYLSSDSDILDSVATTHMHCVLFNKSPQHPQPFIQFSTRNPTEKSGVTHSIQISGQRLRGSFSGLFDPLIASSINARLVMLPHREGDLAIANYVVRWSFTSPVFYLKIVITLLLLHV